MINVDIPASKRSTAHGSAQIPPYSFDPIPPQAIVATNDELKNMFFVSGVSSVDIDDDNLPTCSQVWPKYGMKRTPTKVKKLQHVMHITCTTGSRNICHITLDTLDLKLADMLHRTIKDLCSEEAM